jgi:TfoX/Sxy family transcriptional regulator of competence genes
MEIPKPSDEDKARFRALVPDDPRVDVKPMFGNLGGFVNGNMFMGLFGSDIGVKLPSEELERVTEAGGGPFGPVERPMGGYVTLPGALAPAEQQQAVGVALAFVATQPAKKPKKAKKAAP